MLMFRVIMSPFAKLKWGSIVRVTIESGTYPEMGVIADTDETVTSCAKS